MGKKISEYSLIALSFMAVILIGSILLTLPISANDGYSVSFLEALFTATSAVTVTGLVVNDVSVTFNYLGKTVIMILIQLGGLGVLTFSSLIVLLVSRKISYFTKKIIQEDLNYQNKFDIYLYIKKVAMVVFLIEFIGAFFLFFQFKKEFDLFEAIFYSIFHSISAFCNAGFSLFSDNLAGYVGNPLVNFTIISLIVLGSAGYIVVIDVYEYFTGKVRKLSINSKLAITVTFILIILGMLSFLFFEFNNTLSQKNIFEKIMISLFHSITTRTAGFNTVDLSLLKVPTALIMSMLMFIGASSGSTGGGLKTNTLAIIILGLFAFLKDGKDIEFSKKRITKTYFNKAITVFCMMIAYLCIALVFTTYFEDSNNILLYLFELISAISTTGLSLGNAATFTVATKIILIITMFLGRVGLLTVLLALASRKNKVGNYKYPEENILIG